jgi:UDP-2,3-diacylglucosamine pyrophosphatase LpxH
VLLFLNGCAAGRIVAVSDLHLGDPRSLLSTDEGVDLLASAAEDAATADDGALEELVVTGDVLELIIAEPEDAWSRLEHLMARLQEIHSLERVVFVMGNHDRGVFRAMPAPRWNEPYRSGTPIHRHLDGVAGRLEVVVAYPAYEVDAREAVVHFTHGHYFDPFITPTFNGLDSVAEIESRNRGWMEVLEAGKRHPEARRLMRSAYHVGQHAKGLLQQLVTLAQVSGPTDAKAPGLEEDRIQRYLRNVVGRTQGLTLVYGHNHRGHPEVRTMQPGPSGTVSVCNLGPWVTNHHGGLREVSLAVVNPKTGAVRVQRVSIPEDLERRVQEAAYPEGVENSVLHP